MKFRSLVEFVLKKLSQNLKKSLSAGKYTVHDIAKAVMTLYSEAYHSNMKDFF